MPLVELLEVFEEDVGDVHSCAMLENGNGVRSPGGVWHWRKVLASGVPFFEPLTIPRTAAAWLLQILGRWNGVLIKLRFDGFRGERVPGELARVENGVVLTEENDSQLEGKFI